ncbi:acyl-CoA dehydratase activase-related protein [Veillonella sp.]|uniref:acyl-CoA dehydratase activase-related protein n=1 Tax=Veillonella sp. TaxID=1926307 RepID=UPI00290B4EF5|nr:acyl-CoA dehydratase activase-related protein [Veillonella sp.]MDU5246424.1 acyl-CoA dehydratase activase-related protein [Veillonella sp.]
MQKSLRMGIDVGSTTVKVVLLDEQDNYLYKKYIRHYANILDTVHTLLQEAQVGYEEAKVHVAITGSGGMAMADKVRIPFVQEVIAETKAIKALYPQTDVIIELGGEDAKVTYLGRTAEHRMNGSCAGGTGAFIDQMATLLQTDASGLNQLAMNADTIYPIAARCGVFAKTDVQALLNQGASHENIAKSVFQAIVNQTIAGLACGHKIEGNVAFLGGPLTFLSELRQCFCDTLELDEAHRIIPENGELFIALGAALMNDECRHITVGELTKEIGALIGVPMEATDRVDPLFRNEAELEEFRARHAKAVTPKGDIKDAEGPCYLGIDAGSTTLKVVLINSKNEIIFSHYGPNHGKPLEKSQELIEKIYSLLPKGAYIAHSGVTGYGEAFLKRALGIDIGEVETIAHYRAAQFFCPDVSFILDIGGQDMKCTKVRDGYIEDIVLNEACSSGCGSFIDTFATSLRLPIEQFAKEGLLAPMPIDLGSRCTVFMNSKVKQAQKEGATVPDIAAGLAYSVIKNALYKVLKVKDPKELGDHIVVQGGTFYNEAVLRAFEKLMGVEVIRPDVSGLMGAYGMALLASEAAEELQNQHSSLLDVDGLKSLQVSTSMRNCGLCSNNCMLTINAFSDGRTYVTGNRCDRGAGDMIQEKHKPVPNMVEVKLRRYFDYFLKKNIPEFEGKLRIGIPRVLNMYEDFPFWFTFFNQLGCEVILSDYTTKDQYNKAIDTIPSDTACYPAKAVHGHIRDLAQAQVDLIWYPCIQHGPKEFSRDNNYHCPMVISYPELIRNNMQDVMGKTPFYAPFLPLADKKSLVPALVKALKELPFSKSEISSAVDTAWAEQEKCKADYREMTKKTVSRLVAEQVPTIVLAGRPYHLDSGINHGIPELITSLGMAVLTEDGVAPLGKDIKHLRVVDQWSYHSRLYHAAEFVSRTEGFQIVELNSFGCGLDSIVADQVKDILSAKHKIHTLLKIDEGTNLGAVTIRLRSLQSVMERSMRKHHNPEAPIETVIDDTPAYDYERVVFTEEMRKTYKILVPQMSPLHFQLLEPVLKSEGYDFDMLPAPTREDVEIGLKYINNDACYPAIIVVGQLMSALLSGKYDINKTAVIISQTGGGCRATNYIGYLRKALIDAGMKQVPILSLNASDMERQPGFKLTKSFLHRMIQAVVYGDALMQCVLATRPYEINPGSADALCDYWVKKLRERITKANIFQYSKYIKNIIEDFDNLPVDKSKPKPRVGVVGEIYVKFHPSANNHINELIEKEGGEVVTSGLLDFFLYCAMDSTYRAKHLDGTWLSGFFGSLAREALELYRLPYAKAVAASKHFDPLQRMTKVAKEAAHYIDLGNQCGEGWFLTGDMIDLIEKGAKQVVCLQPFGCLPNHVSGKGMVKTLSEAYPDVRIAAIDYDPGSSAVNQANRLKLLLATMFE